MNRNSVIIKSNPNGLIIMLDPEIGFDELLMDVSDKFREAARFFKNATMAVTFRGRVLTHQQERQLVDTITENSHLHIACLVDENPETEQYYKEAVVRGLELEAKDGGQFYRGTLKAGQVLETENSVIVLGNVNPGAQVISKGNIVVLGCCMGHIYAGASGNEKCFAAALVMKPNQVRIADKIARSAITKRVDTGEYKLDPKITYIKDGHIKTELISEKTFRDMF